MNPTPGVFIPEGIRKEHASFEYIQVRPPDTHGNVGLSGYWCGMPIVEGTTIKEGHGAYKTKTFDNAIIHLVAGAVGQWFVHSNSSHTGHTTFTKVSGLRSALDLALQGIYKYDDNNDFFYVTGAYIVEYPGTLTAFQDVQPPTRVEGQAQTVTIPGKKLTFNSVGGWSGTVVSGGTTRTCKNLTPFLRTPDLFQKYWRELPLEFAGSYYVPGGEYPKYIATLATTTLYGGKYTNVYYVPELKFAIGAAMLNRTQFTILNGKMTYTTNSGNEDAEYFENAVIMTDPYKSSSYDGGDGGYGVVLGLMFVVLAMMAMK
jgi:hypothetical protein